MGNTAMNDTDVTELLNDVTYNQWRRQSYETHDDPVRVSAWVNLVKDSKYFIQADMTNNGGTGRGSVGVEIEMATLNATHPRNVKEVQKLKFMQDD